MKTQISGRRVLFISHDASRTGAPILLLNLLRWLKVNSDLSFSIILRNGGVLEPEFSALAPVSNLTAGISASTRWLPRGSTRIGLRRTAEKVFLHRLKTRLLHENFGLVYANTVTNGDILEFLSDLRCPVVCHVHELEYGIQHYTDAEKFGRVKEHTSHYIAASEAVRRNLVANHNIPNDKIDTVHSFITVSSSQGMDQEGARINALERLNIPRDAMIVAASGNFEWRKGPDLFIQLARSVCLRQRSKPVHFVWIGGKPEGARFEEMMHDIRYAGVDEYVHLVGQQADPLAYFAACDVFAMISREDPFPLVSLEVASLGKPIVCFDGSGGAKEFVEDDCGYVVPYLDVESMAHRVEQLLGSVELRQRFGRQAADKVRRRHDVSIAAPKILSIIKQFLSTDEEHTVWQ
jgi:glycosyltransferase involved in cell wall biosynthesis